MTFLVDPFRFVVDGGAAALDYRQLVQDMVPNLVSYWPMDGEADELTDQVGAHDLTNNGTATDADQPFAEVPGGCRLFDGTNDNMIASTPLSAGLLIGCLVKPSAAIPSTEKGIMSKWLSSNGIILCHAPTTGRLRVYFAGTSLNGLSALSTGWQFVMFSSGADQRRLYLGDKIEVSSISTSSHGTTGSTNFEIGSYGNNIASTRFPGRIAHAWVANAQPGFDHEAAIAKELALAGYGNTFAAGYPYNDAAKLTIPVVGTSGVEAIHPDVVDMGSTWNGYRYWMVHTPYNGTADTEQPCIVATNDITDGGTWVVPTGYTNPITADPVGTTHMADTDVVYDASTDRLHVFYVTTDESTFQDIRSKYTDGSGAWSTEVTVLAGADGAYVNPSVIPTTTGWRVYYTDETTGSAVLKFRDSTTAPDSGYGAATTCTLSLPTYGGTTRKIQNLNVVKDTNGEYVAVVSDALTTTLEGTLLFARSTDGGTTFTLTGPPVVAPIGSTAWDSGGIYRAALLVNANGVVVKSGSTLHCWYSAYQTTTTWGTGYAALPDVVLNTP